MVEFIESETKRIILKFCEKYSKEKKLDLTDVQVVLGLNENGNTYWVCEKQKAIKEMSFNDLMGVKIDFSGYSQIAPPFILKSIIRLAEENETKLEETCVMCFPSYDNDKKDLLLAVYEGYKFIKQINVSELFLESDFELPI